MKIKKTSTCILSKLSFETEKFHLSQQQTMQQHQVAGELQADILAYVTIYKQHIFAKALSAIQGSQPLHDISV